MNKRNAICPNLKTDGKREKRKQTNFIVHYLIIQHWDHHAYSPHMRSHGWHSMWASARLSLACEHRRISARYFSGGEKRRSEIHRLVAWGKNEQEKKSSSWRAWAYWQRIVCTKKRAMTVTWRTAAPFPQACGRNVAINIKVTIVRRTMKLNLLYTLSTMTKEDKAQLSFILSWRWLISNWII